MEKTPNWEAFLIEALREEIATREAELDALRSSVRFRLGGMILESFPPNRRALSAIGGIFRLALRRRDARANKSPAKTADASDIRFGEAAVIVFGYTIPSSIANMDAVKTDSADIIGALLDEPHQEPRTLVMRILSEKIIRRVERARLAGWRVVWCPENGESDIDDALSSYVQAHVDDVWAAG